ncbi:class I SAM-dependent methyltransferase [candidate division TA06 bacterium]|nr:class I SAM-dependent methyltransferase [candidate division TA06 bacterium]
MNIFHPANLKDHQLLDSGRGQKLERFSGRLISRPEPNAVWEQKLDDSAWRKADARFVNGNWELNNWADKPWIFSYGNLKFELKLSPYKHTGIFPEQAVNWDWCGKLIRECGYRPNVLNLFGYTGAATVAAAAAGARVTQVDSSKPATLWARHNAALSGMEETSFRWIVDDCSKFVEREVKRKARYDAVIMDPPSFGRDHKGKIFRFGDDVPELIHNCGKILSDQPLFFLVNAYSTNFSSQALKNLLADILPLKKIECGELHLEVKDTGRSLPCSIFVRYG